MSEERHLSQSKTFRGHEITSFPILDETGELVGSVTLSSDAITAFQRHLFELSLTPSGLRLVSPESADEYLLLSFKLTPKGPFHE